VRNTLFILARLTDADLDHVLREGRRQSFAKGQRLVTMGVPVEWFDIVVSGAFEARTGARESVFLRKMYRGEIVGEVSFLDHRASSASVIAIEPSVVLRIPKARLEAILDADTGFAARFYRSIGTLLAYRLRDLTEKHAGGGSTGEEDALDLDVLDQADLAARRFDRLIARLGG
jgi:CRP-like cAMP-binding protein